MNTTDKEIINIALLNHGDDLWNEIDDIGSNGDDGGPANRVWLIEDLLAALKKNGYDLQVVEREIDETDEVWPECRNSEAVRLDAESEAVGMADPESLDSETLALLEEEESDAVDINAPDEKPICPECQNERALGLCSHCKPYWEETDDEKEDD